MKYLIITCLFLFGCDGRHPSDIKAEKERKESCIKECQSVGAEYQQSGPWEGCRCKEGEK